MAQTPSTSRSTLLGTTTKSQIRNDRLDFFWSGTWSSNPIQTQNRNDRLAELTVRGTQAHPIELGRLGLGQAARGLLRAIREGS